MIRAKCCTTFWMILFGASFFPFIGIAEDRWLTPSPALSLLERIGQHADGSPFTLHALWIELDHPALQGFLANTPFKAGGLVSEFAIKHDLAAAWNANFFSSMSRPCGVMQGDGVRWLEAYDEHCQGAMAFSDDPQPQVQMFLQPDASHGLLAPWMRHVIAGAPGFIVDEGSPLANIRCDDLGSIEPCTRHARLSVGLDVSGHRLLVVTIDRGEASAGATLEELAYISSKLGAYRAINLCGGSRATLYVRDAGGVVNRPSSGAEQPVCCQIGLRLDPLWFSPPPSPDPDLVASPSNPPDDQSLPSEPSPNTVSACRQGRIIQPLYSMHWVLFCACCLLILMQKILLSCQKNYTRS